MAHPAVEQFIFTHNYMLDPKILVDGKFGHGFVPSADAFNQFPKVAIAATAPVDFVKGFDVRNVLGGDIPVKNQMTSTSCVGQGFAYYLWILHVLNRIAVEKKNLTELREAGFVFANSVQEFSAKAIYSQISLGYDQGARFVDAANLAINWGAMFETNCPSHKADGTTDETFMMDKTWQSDAATFFASMLQSKQFATLDVETDISAFAAAIQANNGLVGGVIGSNGHGWGYDENPTPPNPGDALWGHCLLFGAYGTDAKGIFVASPNSWGQYVARPEGAWQPGFPPGYGWQKIRPDYVTKQWMYEPLMLVDKVETK